MSARSAELGTPETACAASADPECETAEGDLDDYVDFEDNMMPEIEQDY